MKAMTTQEILELISQGESQTLEFKRQEENNKDFAKVFVAFANTQGGSVLVGIDDNGNILGTTDKDKLMLRLNDIAYNHCQPPVSIFIESHVLDNKEILKVIVMPGLQKPYKVGGITYIRANNQVRATTREEEIRLYQSSYSIFYDEIPVSQADISVLNIDLFEIFLRKYIEIETTEEEIINYLKNFHLITKEKIPTVTGILFFGNDPQRFLPHAKIVCAAFHENDISAEPYDKKEMIGTIPSVLEDIERFFKIHLLEKHSIKDFEPETYQEIPLTALRELVVNSIAHRDYTISAPNRILIFSNRIEIHSVGVLPNTVNIESVKVGGSHVLRNPTIYNILVKMKMVTDLGSGIRRAIKIIKGTTSKEPDFELSENEFIIKIFRK